MLWSDRAESAQEALRQYFWNPEIAMYNIETPCPNGECNTIFHYWWMAHAVDVLVDGLLRSKREIYAKTLAELHEGILRRNGGGYPNELYDDMEWMAIAWLRAYNATGHEAYKETVLLLWEDIQTGWNDHMGGGIAWHKSQLDYKNTPANAPAVILAARLYQCFGKEQDLEWAHRIYDWQKQHLVDLKSGIVWDGINRTGDGSIDKGWKFTYCQGVFIGAGVELYRATGESVFLEDALKTAAAAEADLSGQDGMLPNEEDGDGGLFKGILVRYLSELCLCVGSPGQPAAALLVRNADSLWEAGSSGSHLFGTDWRIAPAGRVSLSTQLSGMKLLEQMAELERKGILPQKV
ncbi:glycoside hydrolase family 76 protein [Paenibacillus dokdonensis]|uniref:Glycoside hydrolase family 76 protein n=1 Tax=Paenibacillus dokdonensis TaxID=2567944 RepID=A0ABU6GP17_9BACL|nr:glycoside hydrolase family 76 protein [Paenibacillus dokdonensis]MEC0240983.1 glycoside hydrolase family 76 protein [Paenibacillus dokdonensis]